MSLIAEQAAQKYKNQVEEAEESRIARNQSRRDAVASGAEEVGAPRTTGQVLAGGVVLSEVEPGSIAEELGISPGDRLLEINDAPARDAIQLRMADSSEVLSLTIAGADGAPQKFEIEKDAFESVGIQVDAELFDGVKRCANKCPFCFVDQLPPRLKSAQAPAGFKNLRRTLYVRDDDFRLSFLHGHYITLTNLKDADYKRIIEEKLSPLCVSVHATDPAVRIRMVGNKSGGAIMERLKYLLDNGITVNAQIVLCPGVNDGDILRRSIDDLLPLFPGVESVAVVPVGLTRWMPDDRGMRVVEPDEAEQVLELLAPIQKAALKATGTRFVYPSDEMYLLAGRAMPPSRFYDGFPQFANGVGTIRAFLDEVARLRKRSGKQVLASATPPKLLSPQESWRPARCASWRRF
jgi:putative radical SAM enzyme (TIGR03279 family)